jgi:predicted alpha/beta-fold hydrolase
MESNRRAAALDAPFAVFRPLLRSGHLQTIAGRYWPTNLDEARYPTTDRLFETEPGVCILARCNRANQGPSHGTILAVHGLTASSEAPYMRTLAQTALAAGFDVVRVNVRNCGNTEHLSPTLYHSGLTVDLRHVVEQLAPARLFLAGFSMGGNMVMKLAGEWGAEPPANVAGVCGISVPICLATCARELGRLRNRIYELRFLRELSRTLRKKQRLMPARFSSLSLEGVRSIYEFDDRVTARAFGFRDADDYYEQSSSRQFLKQVRLPALLIQAQDDPFVPYSIFGHPDVSSSPCVRLLAVEHGGHVAFLAREGPRFWAIGQTVEFFKRLASVETSPKENGMGSLSWAPRARDS